jgi:hypothetical protein
MDVRTCMGGSIVSWRNLIHKMWILVLAFSAAAAASPLPGLSDATVVESQQPALLRRLAYTLQGLRHSAQSDPALRDVLSRMRLEVPLESQLASFPNAYAMPGDDQSVIRFETDFARQLTGLSSAGAYLDLAQWAGDEPSAREQLCAILRAKERQATHAERRLVIGIDLSKLPQAEVPETLRALQQLRMSVMDDVLAWFLLHEAGHHVSRHRSVRGEPLVDSRRREAEADAFASRTMLKLGFGLHRVERFLAGMAAIDACVAPLGYGTDEASSTHPSWATRAISMRRGFDVSGVGDGYPRLFYIPSQPMNIALLVAGPGHDSESRVIQTGESGQPPQGGMAASQWRGTTVTVYVRSGDDNRVEFQIADAHAPIADIVQRRIDPAGHPIGLPVTLPGIQLSPQHMGWLEVAPGVLSGDLRSGGVQGLLRSILTTAGIPPATGEMVLAAAETLRVAQSNTVVQYMKGTLSAAETAIRLRTFSAAYARQYNQLLDAAQRERVSQVVDNHALRRWAPGQPITAYDDVTREMAERNWSWLPP